MKSRTGEDEERNELMDNGYISWHGEAGYGLQYGYWCIFASGLKADHGKQQLTFLTQIALIPHKLQVSRRVQIKEPLTITVIS
jgi:hypothetical protein